MFIIFLHFNVGHLVSQLLKLLKSNDNLVIRNIIISFLLDFKAKQKSEFSIT